jgi:hypothetical protein
LLTNSTFCAILALEAKLFKFPNFLLSRSSDTKTQFRHFPVIYRQIVGLKFIPLLQIIQSELINAQIIDAN